MRRHWEWLQDSVARILTPEIEMFRVVVKKRGHFSCVVPISGGQRESGGGEQAYRSV